MWLLSRVVVVAQRSGRGAQWGDGDPVERWGMLSGVLGAQVGQWEAQLGGGWLNWVVGAQMGGGGSVGKLEAQWGSGGSIGMRWLRRVVGSSVGCWGLSWVEDGLSGGRWLSQMVGGSIGWWGLRGVVGTQSGSGICWPQLGATTSPPHPAADTSASRSRLRVLVPH